ncbi:CBS domain-containing protein [Nocardiopsis alba]|uniref:CBS domain-containing protein n=2 Tax=Nocardiopsis alba TaxID=53437 RepID=A0ABV5DQP4_9ACTN|nr:CBS domain-containing protein [Nocardiopsis alba]AFR10494.1 CBS domain protein [Nocardiopsis alba ATCC BAA-2165]
MVDSIVEVMTPVVYTVTPDTTLREAAEIMRDQDVGDVVVLEDDHLRGILTDRDIVVRCVAEGGDPETVTVGEVCSSEPVTVPHQSSVGDAVHTMRVEHVRRLPVVDGEEVTGIVTIGDLALAVDEDSALAEVSGAAPNR